LGLRCWLRMTSGPWKGSRFCRVEAGRAVSGCASWARAAATHEEDRVVETDEVVVAVAGVEFNGKAARVAGRVGVLAAVRDRAETAVGRGNLQRGRAGVSQVVSRRVSRLRPTQTDLARLEEVGLGEVRDVLQARESRCQRRKTGACKGACERRG
jgi:hypothetical protein